MFSPLGPPSPLPLCLKSLHWHSCPFLSWWALALVTVDVLVLTHKQGTYCLPSAPPEKILQKNMNKYRHLTHLLLRFGFWSFNIWEWNPSFTDITVMPVIWNAIIMKCCLSIWGSCCMTEHFWTATMCGWKLHTELLWLEGGILQLPKSVRTFLCM